MSATRPDFELRHHLHEGQVDKAEQPQIGHVERVARNLVERFPDASGAEVQAALLHDVLEDTGATPAMLDAAGIDPLAVELVKAHRSDMPYQEWIRGIAVGRIEAIRVKSADLADNMDPARTAALPGAEERVRRKYVPAKATLEAALATRAG